VTFIAKNSEERTFRKDLLCIDVNDRINLTEVGVAMLRGFDIPAFRKDIQREIRQTKQVPSIEQFWSNWLHEMSNAVRTIEATFRELWISMEIRRPAFYRCEFRQPRKYRNW
jgi:hypothetical protein